MKSILRNGRIGILVVALAVVMMVLLVSTVSASTVYVSPGSTYTKTYNSDNFRMQFYFYNGINYGTITYSVETQLRSGSLSNVPTDTTPSGTTYKMIWGQMPSANGYSLGVSWGASSWSWMETRSGDTVLFETGGSGSGTYKGVDKSQDGIGGLQFTMTGVDKEEHSRFTIIESGVGYYGGSDAGHCQQESVNPSLEMDSSGNLIIKNL